MAMAMAASAETGSSLSPPVVVEGSCAIGACVGLGVGVAVGFAGVGVGVATAQAATPTMTVFETVTWLLAIRTNAVNVPPPVVNVALAFCEASAVTFTICGSPSA